MKLVGNLQMKGLIRKHIWKAYGLILNSIKSEKFLRYFRLFCSNIERYRRKKSVLWGK